MARVLVIDDDVVFNHLLEEHLKREGFEVTSASMATEGLEKALTNPPDLIMLDVMLPDGSGYQTCGKLRKNPQTHFIPIIMMTSTACFPSQKELGRIMGATEYLIKPLDLDDTGYRVHTLLGESVPPPKAAPAPKPQPKASEPLLINCQETMNYVGPSRLVLEPPYAKLFDSPAN